MDAQREAFKEEAYELLSELESSLLELEENPEDIEIIGQVFRAMHTIKGSGAMFGFLEIADFTHNVETVFDQVREGNIKVTRELVNLTLSARDHIKDLLNASEGGEDVDQEKADSIISGLQLLLPEGIDPESVVSAEDDPDEPEKEFVTTATYRIRFRPAPEIFTTGTNPIHLLNELRELGECIITAYTNEIPPLDEINPEYCYIFWDIILSTNSGINAIKDVFIFVEDDCDIKIDLIDGDGFDYESKAPSKLGEILVKRGDVEEEALTKVLEEQPRLGTLLVKEKIVSQASVDSALVEQEKIKEKVTVRKEKVLASSIRVPAEKLDQLVDLVGELVTVQARLTQKADTQSDPDLVLIAEEVEMLTAGLRDNAMSIRMLQIGTTFSNFKRLVRDLSNELGKNIVLTTSGGETELDKTVIEKLKDPLVHIIRNSIDHGIESPEIREKEGKPETGKIHLSAKHSGANVLIKIADDGKGLDPEVLRKKAEDKGIISADAVLTEKETLNLIFAPGFSTATEVTDVSGRGVGMDVVKKSIESLRGSIEMDSTLGKGTTITLKLPLTLAIIDGLLVTIGNGYFVLPLLSVEECVELPRDKSSKDNGRHILNVRGEIVPYILLRDEYNINEERPDVEQVVIMETNGKRIGFVVDNVIGGHQTVIKNIGTAFKAASDISGATILGDGTVALIIDVNKILDH